MAALAGQVRHPGPWLATLHEVAPRRLADKPMLLVWGTRDPAFGGKRVLEHWTGVFPHAEVIRLEKASHYVQEDEPQAVSLAIRRRFG